MSKNGYAPASIGDRPQPERPNQREGRQQPRCDPKKDYPAIAEAVREVAVASYSMLARTHPQRGEHHQDKAMTTFARACSTSR
jgi:hypothetical protein